MTSRARFARTPLMLAASALGIISLCGCVPPAITFGSDVTASLGDNATTAYSFTSPALGNNASIAASFRVEDATPDPLNPGTWKIEVRRASDNGVVASAGAPASGPTLLTDVAFAPSTAYNVLVTEVAGPLAGTPPARAFRLRMGPRQNVPATPIATGGVSVGAFLLQGEVDTYQLHIAPGQEGQIDVFLKDNVTPGSNVVTVLNPDGVTALASDMGAGDVSLDGSEIDGFAFAAGDYRLLVSNVDTGSGAGQGSYTLYVGPAPRPVQTIAPPTFQAPVVLAGVLNPVGDRVRYEFTSAIAFEELTAELVQTSGAAAAANELRISQNGAPVTSRSSSGSVKVTAAVDPIANATYQVEVNNLRDGTFAYTLTLRLGGACVGCALSPGGATQVLAHGGQDVAVPIRGDQNGAPLAADAVASFQLDRGAGSYRLEIHADPDGDGVAQQVRFADGSGDLYLDNADLATAPGGAAPFAVVRRVSNGDATVALRMGKDLRPAATAPLPLVPSGQGGAAAAGAIEPLGEAYFAFSLPHDGQIGIQFDDRGIGGGKNVVRVYPESDFDCFLTNPACPALLETSGTGDLDLDAQPLAAGDYVLVVDNDALGGGPFAVAVGPGDDLSDEDGRRIVLAADLTPSSAPVVQSGFLFVADTDVWTLGGGDPLNPEVQTVTQAVTFRVEEVPSISATSVEIALLVFDAAQGKFVPVATKSAASEARLTATLDAGKRYRLSVDASGPKAVPYVITVTDSGV